MLKNKFLIAGLILIFSVSLVDARFNLNSRGTFIEKNYTEGDFIRGELNISFSSQANRNFTSNTAGTVSLLDILLKSQYSVDRDFSCVPKNCKNDLVSEDLSSGNERVNFTLNEKKFYGFILSPERRATNISIFEFNFTSDIKSSCSNQIDIDIFNDGEIDFYNNVHSGEVCDSVSKNYGCFKNDRKMKREPLVIERSIKYCEKITLPPAPGYRIGAHIIYSDSGEGGIQIRLYEILENGKGSYLNGCTILRDMINQTEDVSCNINYSSIKEFNSFVCVNAEKPNSRFKIKYREANDSCGGAGNPESEVLELSTDYQIYAQPLKYAAVRKIKIDEETYEQFNDKDLIVMANQYIYSTYKNNCPVEGCIIPIALKGSSQNISLEEGLIRYKVDRNSLEEKKFYELFEREARLTSNKSLKIDVSKMLIDAPKTAGYSEFRLYFDDNEILKERVYTLVGFSFGIGPRSVLLGKKTTFAIHSDKNVTSSVWKFGDGSNAINIQGTTASHTYSSEGEYLVEVTAINKKGESSTKKFRVLVGEPKKSADVLLADEKKRIQGLKQALNTYPSWMKNPLQTKLGMQEKENSILAIENRLKALGENSNASEYVSIVESLLDLKIPDALATSERGALPADIGYKNIDVGVIAEISGAQISDVEATKSQILKWIEKNYAVEISFESISALYDNEKEKIATKYSISATRKPGADTSYPYLIIKQPLNTITMGSTQQIRETTNKQTSYFSLDPSKSRETFDFVITHQPPSIDLLGIYVSPTIQNLGSGEKPLDTDNLFVNQDGSFRWRFFLFWISLLGIFILAIYIILQTWYKRHYEKSLFKNPDDLYNLINFIYNSRRSKIKDSETKIKLLEKKWKKEQVSYAFKKIDGKRTGMWEIPLFKIFENRKVKKELERKQHNQPIDTRFIKHPSL